MLPSVLLPLAATTGVFCVVARTQAAMSKTVLVTGANTGIGYALCKLLATEHGCSVLLGSRTKSKGEKAVADIKKLAPNASVELVEIDVSSDESVAAAAAAVKAKGVTLYGLAPCKNQNCGVRSRNWLIPRRAGQQRGRRPQHEWRHHQHEFEGPH